jgi:enoyl-CoA hydratase
MDTLKTLTYEVTGRIARITLNRPERGNGITLEMPAEIAACVERANLDPAVHVIALAGNGKGFCGGYDLVLTAEQRIGGELISWPTGSPMDPKVQLANHDPEATWDPMLDYAMMSRNVRGFMSLFHSDKPVICKVHGFCVAGGTDMALCADLLLIEDTASIGVYRQPHCGLIASDRKRLNAFCSRATVYPAKKHSRGASPPRSHLRATSIQFLRGSSHELLACRSINW